MIKTIFYSIIFFYIFYFFLKNFFYNLFLDKDFSKEQSFHKQPTPRFGGLLLSLTAFSVYTLENIDNSIINLILLLPFLNLILGTLDDVKFLVNPVKRFFLFLLINFAFIIFYKIKINFFDFVILDYLNSFFFISFIIAFFCIFFSVNGSNLIDGFNGLLTIHSIIIFFILFMVSKTYFFLEVTNLISIILICLLIFLLNNFPFARIFLGDGGSFFLGTLISMIVIYLSNNATNISPFFFAILIYYIFFEILFSVFRKLFQKKNPFLPDKYHLHMLLYYFLLKKKFNKIDSNYLTSIIINLYYLISIIPVYFFYKNSFICKVYFVLLIFNYLIIYRFLALHNKNYEKN